MNYVLFRACISLFFKKIYNISKGLRLTHIIAFAILYVLLMGHSVCSCSAINTTKEGFQSESQFSKYTDNTYNINTSSWGGANMTLSNGQPNSKEAQRVLNRPKQPVPLAPNQMLVFETTEFKPECCPNTYTTSKGCACMSLDQYSFLSSRGQTQKSYSEY